jgi:hypothetical protein
MKTSLWRLIVDLLLIIVFYSFLAIAWKNRWSNINEEKQKQENVAKYYSNSVYSFITIKEKYPRAKITKITTLDNLFVYCTLHNNNGTNFKTKLHLVLNNTNLIIDTTL